MQQDLILAKTVVVTFAFLQAIYIGKWIIIVEFGLNKNEVIVSKNLH